MKIAFRIECPHCKWGFTWRDKYVNVGWLQQRCSRCENNFYTKITIPSVTIESLKELPEGAPCVGYKATDWKPPEDENEL